MRPPSHTRGGTHVEPAQLVGNQVTRLALGTLDDNNTLLIAALLELVRAPVPARGVALFGAGGARKGHGEHGLDLADLLALGRTLGGSLDGARVRRG